MIFFRRIRFIFTYFQFFITVSIVILLMFLFRKHNHAIRNKWGMLQLKLLGIKLESIGEINNNSNLLLLNHQSMVDIIIFEAISKKNIAWVAKKEIAQLPIYGNILTLPKMIVIDREDKTGLNKLLKETKLKKNIENRPVAIFPEGTRGKGKKLLKFKSGSKIIAQRNNMLVQPIILINTRKRMDTQNFLAESGTVKIIYLPAVKAIKGTNWFEQMEKDMNTIYTKHNTN